MDSTTNPLIYEFHSTTHLYEGIKEPNLRLEVHEYGSDAVQIKLVNKTFAKQKNEVGQHCVFFATTCCCYLWLHLNHSFRLVYMEVFLLLWLVPLLWRLLSIVESETFIYCYDFGMHLQVKKLLGKSNSFITSSNIHDVRINEVVENFDFRYLLIIRTKGKLFQKKPIIPVFKIFKPTCDCLSLIYKSLNQVMLKEA
ncbi:phosphatidylinositol N-acetylglucosaminyltransferase subunit H isoform X1 [Stomoxys calcitrans]|uniref:phosphatidylinositol N-acetylglucosaminyltransferase subunit H isoform X1 n=1 Tax=Stomoxys calcitrans TaxID=35570 RepID=UPI0027E2D75B|nr:phosphatidylinositol N-acetylglucosaminyltransferase subunit H isoform X1 [Stomoxys calcitrans]